MAGFFVLRLSTACPFFLLQRSLRIRRKGAASVHPLRTEGGGGAVAVRSQGWWRSDSYPSASSFSQFKGIVIVTLVLG